MEFWSSIEQLSKISTYLQAVIVVLGIIIGLHGANRKSTLEVVLGIIIGLLGTSGLVVAYKKSGLETAQREAYKDLIEEVDERTGQVRELDQRRLSEKSKRLIVERIKGTKETKIVMIMNNSKESQRYADQFEELFKEAGWDVKHLLPSLFNREDAHEMAIGRNKQYETSESFSVLIEALSACNLEFVSGEFEGNRPTAGGWNMRTSREEATTLR